MNKGWKLGVTGSPGTGKKSVSPTVAGSLGARLVDLNAIALASARIPGSRLIDTRKLKRALDSLRLSNAVVFGHLLPDAFRSGDLDFIAVLRCEPSVLKRRLAARGYPPEKIIQNVEAELIGLVLDETLRTFGKVVREYDATRASPMSLAKRISSDFTGGASQSASWIDWTLRYDSSTTLRSLLSTPSTEPAST